MGQSFLKLLLRSREQLGSRCGRTEAKPVDGWKTPALENRVSWSRKGGREVLVLKRGGR